jgi:glycosyltransferase involved in cell wall biosynthesis
MKILHVVAGLKSSAAGLAEAVPRLARETVRLGHEAVIATVADPDEPLSPATDAAVAEGVRIARFAPSFPTTVFFSWEMARGMRPLVAQADLVHVHSLWTFPVWWACQTARTMRKPLVISPRGCLDPVRLAHSAWKKRLAGVFDRRALRGATAIHATSDAERGWIERYVGGHPRIEVIPNGVEIPPLDRGPKPADRTRQVLYLGRLHPLKGLDLLLDAWRLTAREEPRAERWQLTIAGPDEQGTRARLEKQARDLGLGNVTFRGGLYGADKARALSEADVVVLPSRSENFGTVAAEALAAGVPVIATKGTPWSEIDRSCGWWVDVTAAGIAAALTEAMGLSDDERAAMGGRGRSLVEAKYQWASVGQAMVTVYESITRSQRA